MVDFFSLCAFNLNTWKEEKMKSCLIPSIHRDIRIFFPVHIFTQKVLLLIVLVYIDTNMYPYVCVCVFSCLEKTLEKKGEIRHDD